MWRGATSRAKARASLLARWDERYGDKRTSPTLAELFEQLMPPLHSVGVTRAGATRTLRALALALGTISETPKCVLQSSFPVKTRRLQNFALDALAANVSEPLGGDTIRVAEVLANSDTPSRSASEHKLAAMEPKIESEATKAEQRRATIECATRLLAATHDAVDGFSAFFFTKAEGDDTRATSCATHEKSLRVLESLLHSASTYHARVCDVAASVIRAKKKEKGQKSDDTERRAKTLVRVALDGCVFRSQVIADINDAPSESVNAVSAEDAEVRFSARALTNVAARVFGAKDTALHLVAHTAWFSRLVATDGSRDGSKDSGSVSYSALESFLGAFRVLARTSAFGPFDPVAAANNLVWLVVGWHPPSGLDPAPSAKAARARLAALPRSTVRAFVDTLDSLLAATPDGEIASSDTHAEASRYARVPALREAWFVAGVAREGDDASLDATARLYWRACREGETDGAAAPESRSNRDSDRETREGDRQTSAAALSRRRRLLGALAFAPGTVRRLWLRCASRVSAAVSLGADEQSNRLWTCPATALGVASIDDAVLPTVGAFALAYAHLLEVTDDDEFHDARSVYSFTSGERKAVAAFANTLVVRERLRLITRTKEDDLDAVDVDRDACADACASLLRTLVTRDERRRFAPDGLWLAPAKKDARVSSGTHTEPRSSHAREKRIVFPSALKPEAAAAALFGASEEKNASENGDGFAAFLKDCPHALPFETRVEIFRALVALDRARLGVGAQAGGVDADRATQGQRVIPVCSFRVRRDRILEDTLTALLPLGSRLKGRIAVTFANAAGLDEAGVDAGGLFKELMETSLAELVDPRRGLWSHSSEESSSSSASSSASIYPDARAGDDPESAALLELAGLLFGKALYEGVLHAFRLAPFFAKKLLQRPLSLDDLPSLDGALHRSLKQVMRYEGDVRDLCLDWYAREEVFGAVVARSLRPGEKTCDDVVESHETLQWAHATAEFHLVRRRMNADNAFKTGLFKMIPPSWLRLFGANELGALMTGDADGDVDVDDLKKHCAFGGGYGATSRTVLMFWECVSSFTREERRALLKFVTSSAAPPLGGFQHLHPPFTIHKVRCDVPGSSGGLFGNALVTFGLVKDVQRLPTASTCFNVLKLPNFKRLDTMKAKLRTAIYAGAGFELS